MNIEYKMWDGDPSSLGEYSELLMSTFKGEISKSYLIWKHLENPIGKSIIAFAMHGGKMVGARSFWRMFSHHEHVNVYQPCDTVTQLNYQRKGIFKKLTNLCLDAVNPDDIILNFPNKQSFPAYIKMGWELKGRLAKSFNVSLYKPKFNHASILSCIDPKLLEYINWRFPTNRGYITFIDNEILYIKNSKGIYGRFFIENQSSYKVFSGKEYIIDNVGLELRGCSLSIRLPSRSVIVCNGNLDFVDQYLEKFSPTFLMDTF